MTRTRRGRGAAGQSLFEVVVVVALLSLVMTMVYEGIDAATQAISGGGARLQNLDEARVLMAVATKDMRTATRLQAGTSPFVLANKREVIFYANLNNDGSGSTVVANGPRLVRIYVDASSQLVEQVTKPDASSVPPAYTYSGVATNRFVGRYIANTTANPIFRYYDANGNELTAAPLSAADRLAVDSVQIMLSIRKSTTLKVANTTLLNTVRLPNVDYQNTFGG